jgi:hypothetical protein
MGKSYDNRDTLIQFMHPDGPSPSFHWPHKDDICQVEMESILKAIQPLVTGTGCQHILHEKIKKSITKLFQEK